MRADAAKATAENCPGSVPNPSENASAENCPGSVPNPSENAIESNERLVARALDLRQARIDATPTFLELETTTRCNLDCLQCPRPPGPGGEDLDAELIGRLESFLARTRNVSLHGLGEPLMSRATDRILETIPRDCHVWFSSNLQLLPERLLPLFRKRVIAVSCSLDAATEATYDRIRGGILERSLRNIRRLLAETSARVFINMTVMRVNFQEVGAFLDLGRDLGIHKVVLLKLNEGEDYPEERTRNGFRFSYDNQHIKEAERQSVVDAVASRLPLPFPVEDQVNQQVIDTTSSATSSTTSSASSSAGSSSPHPSGEKGARIHLTSDDHGLRCSLPYTNLSIRIDGSARVCCHQEAIGNIYETDPEHLWNGPALRAMREALAASQLHPLCQRENCPVYRLDKLTAEKQDADNQKAASQKADKQHADKQTAATPTRLLAAARRTLVPVTRTNLFRQAAH